MNCAQVCFASKKEKRSRLGPPGPPPLPPPRGGTVLTGEAKVPARSERVHARAALRVLQVLDAEHDLVFSMIFVIQGGPGVRLATLGRHFNLAAKFGGKLCQPKFPLPRSHWPHPRPGVRAFHLGRAGVVCGGLWGGGVAVVNSTDTP